MWLIRTSTFLLVHISMSFSLDACWIRLSIFSVCVRPQRLAALNRNFRYRTISPWRMKSLKLQDFLFFSIYDNACIFCCVMHSICFIHASIHFFLGYMAIIRCARHAAAYFIGSIALLAILLHRFACSFSAFFLSTHVTKLMNYDCKLHFKLCQIFIVNMLTCMRLYTIHHLKQSKDQQRTERSHIRNIVRCSIE